MRTFISIFIFLSFLGVSNAQETGGTKGAQPGGTTPESETKPLELPDFIIEGREQLNVQTGIKHVPEIPFGLTKSDLDSLNSMEKQPTLLMPPKPLPERMTTFKKSKGYFQGEFGRFVTPDLEGAYEFKLADYDIYANTGLELSQGHVDKAGYNQGFLNFSSDYIAPDKYWVFGGSKTRTTLGISGKDYSLYAAGLNAPGRSSLGGQISMGSEGNYEGYKFSTGAGLKTTQLSQDSLKAFDNALNGYLYISGLWNSYEAGIGASIDLHSVRGDGAHLIQADASFKYIFEAFTIDMNAGLQTIRNTNKISRLGLLLKADGEYRFSSFMTIRASLFSGYINNSFAGMLELNPYVHTNAEMDYVHSNKLKGYINYHPSVDISVSAGIETGVTNRHPVYFTPDTATFQVLYKDTKEMAIFGEIDWQPTEYDKLNAHLRADYSTLDTNGNVTPYSVPLMASLNYRRSWSDYFGTLIGFTYISTRYADIDNKKELPGYFDLSLRAEYLFNENFSVFGRLSNLLNNDVYVWEGYKERSLFVSAGILWKF